MNRYQCRLTTCALIVAPTLALGCVPVHAGTFTATGGETQVGNLTVTTVKKTGNAKKGCVKVSWVTPVADTGDTYGVLIYTKDRTEVHRVETWKTYASMCKLTAPTYVVKVKQYGGDWLSTVVNFT